MKLSKVAVTLAIVAGISGSASADIVSDFAATNGYRVAHVFQSVAPGYVGYVTVGANGPRIIYLAPDKRTVLYGVLTNPLTGEEITATDIRNNQASIRKAMGMAPSAGAQVQPAQRSYVAPQPARVDPPPPVAEPVSEATWKAMANLGYVTQPGGKKGQSPIYIFFDPKCPHCHNLYRDISMYANSREIRWIPVGLLKPDSITLSAAILSAKSSRAVDEAMTDTLKPASDIPPQIMKKLQANIVALNRFGNGDVPTIVYMNDGHPEFTAGSRFDGATVFGD